MRHLFFKTMAITLSLSALSVVPAMAQTNSKPFVIPELKEWTGKTGDFPITPQTRIVYPESDTELQRIAEVFSSDFAVMSGIGLEVSGEKPAAGDIIFSIRKDKELGTEGYSIAISDRVKVTAPDYKGIYWATRTLLQMSEQTGFSTLPKGTVRDFPDYAVRGFMMDCGRKYIPLAYLEKLVKIMSYYKMNTLQVHLNDNGFKQFFQDDWDRTYAAFRLECDTFPGLTARDGSYTKDEFRDFQKQSSDMYVEIIPEIDAPAHTLAFSHYDPELGSKEYGMDHLDLFNPKTYEFMDALFKEYLEGDDPVFVGPKVHIGTDEYNLKEAEQFRYFTNYYLDYIIKLGKTPIMWGSLKKMQGTTPVDVEGRYVNAWNYHWLDVEMALNEGYKVMNMCDVYLYIVPSVNYYQDFLNTKMLYESWVPEEMNRGNRVAKGNKNLLGAMFAEWNDRVGNGISQQDVHYRTFPALQLMSDKLWKGNNADNVPFETFDALCKKMPEAPGVNLLAKIEGDVSVIAPDSVVTLNGNNAVASDVVEVGYPYSVEFEIYADKDGQVRSGILFQDGFSKFLTNWGGAGKFAFERDGYLNVFHGYSLPAETWVKVRVEGNHESTSLYINDKLVECLGIVENDVYNKRWDRIDPFWYYQTLVFPLQQIGDKHIGFKGKIRNVKCGQVEK